MQPKPPSLDTTWEDVENLVLSFATPEKRLQGLSLEERMQGLSLEEVLKTITIEERLRGMSKTQLTQLLRLVQERLSAGAHRNDDASP